jgi:hypothetical protein
MQLYGSVIVVHIFMNFGERKKFLAKEMKSAFNLLEPYTQWS